MKKLYIALIMALGAQLNAQNTDSTASKINFSAFAELYYSYDVNQPSNTYRQNFLYTYNRHNEVNLNLGLVKASYNTENLRANIALMAGTYVQDNMQAEQDALRYVNEANVGIKISKTKNLWIDAGIMPSHIGWENTIGRDNITLTRSLAAENSPYFETGAKISYTSNSGKWLLSGLVLNGWQKIAKTESNQSISFGHQITFKPNEKISFNSSSFIGNDSPKSEKKMRYFHDLYVNWQISPNVYVILGFDIGAEQKEKDSDAYNMWYSPNLLMKYQFADNWSLGSRIEYYSDKHNVVIKPDNEKAFQTFGYSMNIDYSIFKNALFRIEARGFSSKEKIFLKNGTETPTNFFITSSLTAWF